MSPREVPPAADSASTTAPSSGGGTNARMSRLVLGPLLRHVGERDATVWVETDAPCRVEVSAGAATGHEQTFTVGGHHYALVVLDGLEPASSTPYTVRIDGVAVWPPADSTFPPSRIRTIDPMRPIRLLFGSCREAGPMQRSRGADAGPDVLDAFAVRMTDQGARAVARSAPAGRRPGLRRRDVARDAGVHGRPGATSAGRRAPRSPTSRSTPGCIASPGVSPRSAGCCPPCRAR